jgi:hypothetical protein
MIEKFNELVGLESFVPEMSAASLRRVTYNMALSRYIQLANIILIANLLLGSNIKARPLPY